MTGRKAAATGARSASPSRSTSSRRRGRRLASSDRARASSTTAPKEALISASTSSRARSGWAARTVAGGRGGYSLNTKTTHVASGLVAQASLYYQVTRAAYPARRSRCVGRWNSTSGTGRRLERRERREAAPEAGSRPAGGAAGPRRTFPPRARCRARGVSGARSRRRSSSRGAACSLAPARLRRPHRRSRRRRL